MLWRLCVVCKQQEQDKTWDPRDGTINYDQREGTSWTTSSYDLSVRWWPNHGKMIWQIMAESGKKYSIWRKLKLSNAIPLCLLILSPANGILMSALWTVVAFRTGIHNEHLHRHMCIHHSSLRPKGVGDTHIHMGLLSNALVKAALMSLVPTACETKPKLSESKETGFSVILYNFVSWASPSGCLLNLQKCVPVFASSHREEQ